MRINFQRFHPAALLLGALLALPVTSWAQILDRIEVNRINGVAEIRIGFSTQVQYLNHSPLKGGRILNVFIQLIPPGTPEAVDQETLVAPQTDIVPRFTVTYPKLGNAVSISFAQETTWDVRAGIDDRSLVIVVPVLKGARDVMAEVHAQPAAASAPTPAAPPTPPTPAPLEPPAAPPPQQPTQPATPATPAAEAGPATPASPPPTTGAEAEAGGAVVPALTPEQVETFAKGFFDDAKKAIEEKDLARAINRLNRVLGLPTNKQTEAAQALIGQVREMSGEYAKARAEYELYLKLFPQGPDAAMIKQKLAALPKGPVRSSATAAPLQRGPAEWTTYGSLTQYYYTGKSHIEVTTPPPPGLLNFTTDTLSLTDQKALITTVDLNARRRDGVTDTRIVVRDTDTKNYLDNSRSYNRLYSAYVEQSDRQAGYFFRAGRQNPTGGGVLERFDGLNAGYSFGDGWRVNGVAGYPVEFMSPYKKDFYGVSLDMQAAPEHFGFSGYVLQQHMEGVVNREAVGMETRYFDVHSTLYGTLDYDVVYRGVNIAMLQGNYRSDDGTNYFTYIDHRKTPPYSLTNALPGLPGLSIKDAIATMGINQLRADARALTANSNMLAVGFTHPWSPRWMLGADYRAAAISGTQATATFPAMPGSGTNHVFSGQAIGNGIVTDNDIVVFNGSYIKGATYRGEALGANYVWLKGDTWRIDTNLRYYTQKDDQNEKQVRITPSLKLSYRWNPVTLESEVGSEDVRIDGPLRTERSNRRYIFFGYRVDLR
ncbi:MAG TPA: hypothetical protein VMC81_08150 [Rhodocyclaceae bacterium]|nr:hypothetical protein [Rhodocyclaceae bacterium]